jgi:ketosteroid isomerase-like protein
MLKNSFFAALVAALVMSVAACGDKGDSKPNDAMKKVEAAFESLDAAKLEAVYDADTWKSKGEGMTKEFKEMKENGMKVELTWTESDVVVSGDTATVKTKMTITDKDGKAEDEAETFSFRKTAAGWKCTG